MVRGLCFLRTRAAQLESSASFEGISYTRAGTDVGVPLVFVNGLGGLQEAWFYQVRHFAKSRSVLVYDHRGNGRSAFRSGDASMDTYVDDLCALLDAQEIDVADFVGISFGGRLLQSFALEHPLRVRSLTLSATSAAPAGVEGAALLKEMAEMDEDQFFEKIIPLLFGQQYRDDNAQRLRVFARGRQRRRADPRGLAMQWEAIRGFDLRAEIDAIPHPTLIVHGREDALSPFRAAELMHEKIPDSRLVCLEGVGHSPQVEDWVGFNEAIDTFLQEVEKD